MTSQLGKSGKNKKAPDNTYLLEEVSTDEEDVNYATFMAKRAKNGETFEGQKKTKNYRATFTMVVKKAFLASSIMLIAVSALRFMVME